MLISKYFSAICKGCKHPIKLYEYKGLEGGLYSSHHCKEMFNVPDEEQVYKNLKEIKK